MKLIQRINPEVERKLKDAIFVGRLVTHNDLAGTLINESVYFKDELSGEIQFHIKCLSPIPNELKEQFYFPNNIITGGTVSYNNKIKLDEWLDYGNLYHFEVVEKVRKYLDNKLIVFKLDIKPAMVYVELLAIEHTHPAEKGYLIIPGPELNLNETGADFEKKLVDTRRPFTLKHYPHIFDLPEFIYMEDTLYEVSLNPNPNATTYSQTDLQDVKYYGIGDKFIDLVDARYENHLYFIRKDKMLDLRDLMDEKAMKLQAKDPSEELIRKSAKEIKEIEINEEQPVHQTKYSEDEITFINQLKRNAQKRGLSFKKEDLYAFHISVKTNALSILGGMSGTGKTQLAKLYGETMGLEFGKDLLMISVSPSYHEPNDVLGYLNPTTGVYHESETGLVSLLLDAEKAPEKMFMVIFDEMNLSQVEHWFSPFISMLEIEEKDRYLKLFSENSFCMNDKYKSKIKMTNNVIFVGTVNFDETTKDFSNRLLDRTNVITPTKLSFRESLKMLSNKKLVKEDLETFNVVTKVFRNQWIVADEKTISLAVFNDAEISLLDKLHMLINKDDKQRGISFRVALGIARFIINIPMTSDSEFILDRSVAIDLQLSQRILTKIKGLESYVEPLVGSFDNDVYRPGKIAKLLLSDEAQAISTFDRSLENLKIKAKELMLYGYAK